MKQKGKNILVGSPSLIVALAGLDLIDEYQLVLQPIVLGSGLPLFKNISDRIDLKLLKTKTFGCGAVTLYYEPTGKRVAISKPAGRNMPYVREYELNHKYRIVPKGLSAKSRG